MIFGIIVIIVGLIFLMQNLGYITAGIWSIIWPLLIIAVGLKMIVKRKGGHCWWCGDEEKKA